MFLGLIPVGGNLFGGGRLDPRECSGARIAGS
jgi:hypothetical protein